MRRAWLEFGVLAALLVSFLTVPLPLPHVATATVWAGLATAHVVRRRRIYAGLLRRGGDTAGQHVEGGVGAVAPRHAEVEPGCQEALLDTCLLGDSEVR
jgi:hypothetical protein